MADAELHTQIQHLIDTEHELRRQVASGAITGQQEQERLRGIETHLDQLWDLLRQRQAKREFGQNPDAARLRSPDVVEDYKG